MHIQICSHDYFRNMRHTNIIHLILISKYLSRFAPSEYELMKKSIYVSTLFPMQWGKENIMTIDLGNRLLFLKRKHGSLDIVVCFGWSSINWGGAKTLLLKQIEEQKVRKVATILVYCNKCWTLGNCTLVSF